MLKNTEIFSCDWHIYLDSNPQSLHFQFQKTQHNRDSTQIPLRVYTDFTKILHRFYTDSTQSLHDSTFSSEIVYSKVPNKRTGPNKSTGEKFCQNK